MAIANGKETFLAVLKGDRGEQGPAPVRGVDYWTEEDVAEIHHYIDEKLKDAEDTLALINEGGLV